MLINLISKKFTVKKKLVLNLIYITCATTLFGIFLDYPFEKYDRINYFKKSFFYKSLSNDEFLSYHLSSYASNRRISLTPSLFIDREGNLKLDLKNHLIYFYSTFRNHEFIKCRLYYKFYSNYIEFTFLTFPSGKKKCQEDHEYKFIKYYKAFMLDEIKKIKLQTFNLTNASSKSNDLIINQINNFYEDNMKKFLYFFINLNDGMQFVEKKEKRHLILNFNNTIFFFFFTNLDLYFI